MQQQIVNQRSEQWKKLRLGKFTSSKWHLFTVNSKVPGEPSAGVKTYILELLWELISGHSNEVDTYSMKYGTEWEPFAKNEVRKRYGKMVLDADKNIVVDANNQPIWDNNFYDLEFIQHPTLPYYGGSPDGEMNINGIPTTIETKCPTGKEHLVNIKLLKDIETCKKQWPEIYGQCQSNMQLQGTTQALPVSFQHEAGNDLCYKDLIIPIDQPYIDMVMDKMAEAWEWMKKEAEIFGVDILAKYAEYAKQIDTGLDHLQKLEIPESHFNKPN